MKRSLMVEVLAKYINNYIQYRDDYVEASKHADWIIHEIEQRGMITPFNRTLHQEYQRGSDLIHYCEWESEDE